MQQLVSDRCKSPTLRQPCSVCDMLLVCRVMRLPIALRNVETEEPVACDLQVVVTYCQHHQAAIMRLPAGWQDYLEDCGVEPNSAPYATYRSTDPNDAALYTFVSLAGSWHRMKALLCALQDAVTEELRGTAR